MWEYFFNLKSGEKTRFLVGGNWIKGEVKEAIHRGETEIILVTKWGEVYIDLYQVAAINMNGLGLNGAHHA
jgi:hypothetical protein